MSNAMSEEIINEPNINLNAVNHSNNSHEASLEYAMWLLHLQFSDGLAEKIRNELATYNQHHEQIKFILETIQLINNNSEKDTSLNLQKHPEIQSRLKQIAEWGVQIPLDKTSFSPIERKNLIDTMNYNVDDLKKKSEHQMHRVKTMEGHTEKSLTIVTELMNKLANIKSHIAQNCK